MDVDSREEGLICRFQRWPWLSAGPQDLAKGFFRARFGDFERSVFRNVTDEWFGPYPRTFQVARYPYGDAVRSWRWSRKRDY